MVDILALALSHGLLALAALRLLARPDLDEEGRDDAGGGLKARLAQKRKMRVPTQGEGVLPDA
ncbi:MULTISPECIES: hypothetical protein [Novosphingobium]|uniref:Uncharacterized protein n=1 Tax=Novosphingobium mathurense TaxID=428990 RepID=A0A1U6HDF2_9SPHN|nr:MULTISPECIES: hypothetical protein [Novosphingobium]CDO36758.1 exported hypothetical protein [Novosphingobium sp. KN65.2]SLJ93789.1 hypothetical protein SAMN06295987_102187 [Novosphingobium mathurense]